MRSRKVFWLSPLLVLSCVFLLTASIPHVPTGTWQTWNPMGDVRSGATAVLLQDGRVLIIGGNNANGPVASADLLGTDGNFSAAALMQSPRSGHTATVLSDGRVLVAGGTTSGGGITNSAEIYDPSADSWTLVSGTMVDARSGHTASLLPDGRVLLAGGQNSGGAITSLEIFDPSSGSFSGAGVMTSARMNHAAASLQDGRVLLLGGSDGTTPLASVNVFDPGAGTVSDGPSLSSPRVSPSATTTLDGKVVVIGGNNGASSGPADLATADILVADPSTGQLSSSLSTSHLLTPRSGHQSFLLPKNNAILVVGGSSSGTDPNSAELYYSWADSFDSTGAMSAARPGLTGSALSLDGRFLAAGGTGLASTELYGFATVKTDKSDYAPGEIVTITGSGWQPGETVNLTFRELPNIDTPGPYTAVADGNGNIADTEFAPDVNDVNVRFYLTAVGQTSGFQAQNTFTDASSLKFKTGGTGLQITAPSGATDGTMNVSQPFTVQAIIHSSNGVSWTGVTVTLAVPSSWTKSADPTPFSLAANSDSSPLTWTVTPTSTAGDSITASVSGTPSSGGCSGSGSNSCTDSGSLSVSAVNPASLSVSSFVAQQSPFGSGDFILMAGQSASVRMVIANAAAPRAAANGVSPSSLSVTPTGTAAITCGAGSPGSNNIAGGTSQNFNYTCTGASGDGTLSFGGSASGTDENTGAIVSTDGTSNLITVDSTAPSISVYPASGTYNAPFTFTWSITDPVAGGVSSGVDAATCLVKDGATTISTACSGTSSPLSAGAHSITVSGSDIAGNSASASRSYTVISDSTAPIVTITFANPDGQNGWFVHSPVVGSVDANDSTTGNSNVTAISCTDGVNPLTVGSLSGIGTNHASGSISVADEGSHNISCTATDSANNTGVSTGSTPMPVVVKIDTVKPSLTASRLSPANDNGWNNTNVGVEFTCTDATSGVAGISATGAASGSAASSPLDVTVTTEGANQSVNGSCKDAAGNSADSASVTGINIDKTPPTAVVTPDRGTDHNGWYNHTLTFSTSSSSDALSGIDSCTAVAAYSGPDSASASVSTTCADKAGNTGNGSLSFKYDATSPMGVSGAPNRAPDHGTWYNHAVGIAFSGTDATSGIDSCTTTTYSGPDGSSLTVSGSCTDKAGNTTAPVASSAFSYDATPPTVTVTPDRAPDHNGWYNHLVTFTPSGSDATSGIASCDPASPYSGPDTASGSVTLHCTDQAGNTGSGTASFKYDATPPTGVTAAAERGQDHNGWYNHALTVTWSGTDAISGIDSCTTSPYSGPDNGSASLSGTCTDLAGNSSGSVAFNFKYDATPPIIAFVSRTPANGFGWNNTDVTVNWSCSDATSGPVLPSVSQTVSSEGANQSATGTCTDYAGNTASSTQPGINIDKTKPTVTITTPVNGATYTLNQAVVAGYSCADQPALSGIDKCVGPAASGSNINTSSVGNKSFTVTATDRAGNTYSQTVNYNVQYNVCLLYDPTRAVKSGATYPLKLYLCDVNSNDVSSSGIIVHATSIFMASSFTGTPEDAGNANPDSDFRFDSTLGPSGGYIFNLQTTGLVGGTYGFTFTASNDPTTHTVLPGFGVK